MAEELIELGRASRSCAKGAVRRKGYTREDGTRVKGQCVRKPRRTVCTKILPTRGGYIVTSYDRKSRKVRDYMAAPCLRTKIRKKALVIPTKKAAEAYAKKCGLMKCLL